MKISIGDFVKVKDEECTHYLQIGEVIAISGRMVTLRFQHADRKLDNITIEASCCEFLATLTIFEKLARLEDMDVFQQQASEYIDGFISSAPEERQQRLRQIQWRWDAKMRGTPPALRYNVAVEEFWAMFRDFQAVIKGD